MYNVTLRRVRVTTVALPANYKIFRTAVSNKRFLVVHAKWPIFLPDFKKIWIYTTDFHEVPNIKFHEGLSSENRSDICR